MAGRQRVIEHMGQRSLTAPYWGVLVPSVFFMAAGIAYVAEGRALRAVVTLVLGTAGLAFSIAGWMRARR
jgi:uncharacterized membrane protein YjjP (DUF1212 family)